ncbi:MAG: glycerophosphodiester phosphodiesterase [Candidatus Sericytochromatia bacterium]
MVLNNLRLRFKRKKNQYKRVLVIAHRGFSGIAPENTLIAFKKAIESGADMIEFDVSLSKDGIPVVIHDKTVNRTTNGKGNVQDFTLEELKQFDAGSWYKKEFKDEKIPTLEEVIQLTKGKIMLNIEIKKYSVKRSIKVDGIEHKIVKLLEKYDIVNDVLISSFSKLAIQRIKDFNPNISIAFLYRFGINPRIIKKFDKLALYSFNQSKRAFSKKALNELQEQELKLNLYTVNQKREMKKFIKLGVNGIITNYPNRLIEVIDSFENNE